jgi:hypothetical protein
MRQTITVVSFVVSSRRIDGEMMARRSRADGAEPRTPARLACSPSEDEWDALSSALNELGVKHVTRLRRRSSRRALPPRELFERLLVSGDPRLEQSAIVLLLTHPALADDMQSAVRTLTGTARNRGMRRYVAAAAMQRMARTRIALQLGQQPDIPAAFLFELGLPPLDAEFGRETLLALSRQEEDLHGHDAWGSYRSLLDLFLVESRRTGWGHIIDPSVSRQCDNVPIEPI